MKLIDSKMQSSMVGTLAQKKNLYYLSKLVTNVIRVLQFRSNSSIYTRANAQIKCIVTIKCMIKYCSLPFNNMMENVCIWCDRFRAHFQPHYSVKSCYYRLVLYTLRTILPYSCLRGVLRSFQVFLEILRSRGVSSRLSDV